jgi:hypothetical protein
MNKFLWAIAATAVVLGGCTSSSTNPTTILNFLSAKQGTTFTQVVRFVEDNGSGGTNITQQYTDTAVVGGKSNQTDEQGLTKEGQLFEERYLGVPLDSTYLHQDGSKLYFLFPLEIVIPNVGNIDAGNIWALISDQNAGTWTAFRDTLENVQYTLGCILPITMNVIFSADGSKVGNENLTINGKTVATTHLRVLLKVNITVVGGIITAAPLTIPFDYWVAENVGIVKRHQAPALLQITGLANQNIPLTGRQYETLSYTVP